MVELRDQQVTGDALRGDLAVGGLQGGPVAVGSAFMVMFRLRANTPLAWVALDPWALTRHGESSRD